MNRNSIYSNTIALILLVSIGILAIGLIYLIINPVISKCIIDIGILLLYATPLTALVSLFLYSIYKRDFITSIFIVILLTIVSINILYLGIPPIC